MKLSNIFKDSHPFVSNLFAILIAFFAYVETHNQEISNLLGPDAKSTIAYIIAIAGLAKAFSSQSIPAQKMGIVAGENQKQETTNFFIKLGIQLLTFFTRRNKVAAQVLEEVKTIPEASDETPADEHPKKKKRKLMFGFAILATATLMSCRDCPCEQVSYQEPIASAPVVVHPTIHPTVHLSAGYHRPLISHNIAINRTSKTVIVKRPVATSRTNYRSSSPSYSRSSYSRSSFSSRRR